MEWYFVLFIHSDSFQKSGIRHWKYYKKSITWTRLDFKNHCLFLVIATVILMNLKYKHKTTFGLAMHKIYSISMHHSDKCTNTVVIYLLGRYTHFLNVQKTGSVFVSAKHLNLRSNFSVLYAIQCPAWVHKYIIDHDSIQVLNRALLFEFLG